MYSEGRKNKEGKASKCYSGGAEVSARKAMDSLPNLVKSE